MLESGRYSAVILWIVFSISLTYAQQTKYETAPAKEGERCTVCGMELTENDIALIVKGRRVPLNPEEVDNFIKNQEKYFARLQPRGALFQEDFEAPPGTVLGGIDYTWFLVVLYVITALTFAGFSAYVAVGKGLSAVACFFTGLFLHAPGFVFVLMKTVNQKAGVIPRGLRKVPATHSTLICMICGAENHPSAKRCSGCDVELKPLVESEIVKMNKQKH